ncbi:MAG: MEKHLA domain-containing protein [Cyanobacteriota bacterium]|nr:MEKHLA domain-containing protein [Cyanobacteriota bacterium]
MHEAPWLTPEALETVGTICASHQRAFGRPLIAATGSPAPLARPPEPFTRLLAQELFAATTIVLAHDGADPSGDPGPRLIYGNRAALQLWRRPWRELVGMPSSLTAAPTERASRAEALGHVQRQHAISDYSGIRIDSQGRRFLIRGARVWTLWRQRGDVNSEACGQAAAFSDWHWL